MLYLIQLTASRLRWKWSELRLWCWRMKFPRLLFFSNHAPFTEPFSNWKHWNFNFMNTERKNKKRSNGEINVELDFEKMIYRPILFCLWSCDLPVLETWNLEGNCIQVCWAIKGQKRQAGVENWTTTMMMWKLWMNDWRMKQQVKAVE